MHRVTVTSAISARNNLLALLERRHQTTSRLFDRRNFSWIVQKLIKYLLRLEQVSLNNIFQLNLILRKDTHYLKIPTGATATKITPTKSAEIKSAATGRSSPIKASPAKENRRKKHPASARTWARTTISISIRIN